MQLGLNGARADFSYLPMLCPDCKDPLLIVEFESVELDICVNSKGVWFDSEELRQLFTILELPDGVRNLEERLVRMERAKGEPKRRCPRCRSVMDLVDTPGPKEAVILDRCPDGHGLWFDQGELRAILEAELGAEYEHLERVRMHLGEFIAAGTES